MKIDNLWGAVLEYSPDMDLAALEKNALFLKESGFGGVFIGFTCKYPEITEAFALELKKILQNNGLQIFQLHPLWPDIAATAQIERTEAVNYYKRMIDTAEIMEAGVLILHPGGSESDITDSFLHDSVKNDNIGSLKMLLEYCRGKNLSLAIENMAEYVEGQPRKSRYGRTPGDLLSIVKALDSAQLGICIDTSHALASNYSITEMIEQCGKYIIATHFHDTDGNIDKHLPVGKGIIKWNKVFEAFEKVGYRLPYVLETDLAGALESMAFIRNIL